MSEDEIDKNILDDNEEILWDRLNDFVWKDLRTEEKKEYARTIYTLVKRYGNSYGDILEKTGWSESAGGLAKRIRKILGSNTQPLERKAIKTADKQISEITAKKVVQEVNTNNELGDWLNRTYGPIAHFMGIPIDQLVAQAMKYYLFEGPKQEKLIDDLMEDDYKKTILLDELNEVASPNFIFREKMRWLDEMIKYAVLLRANGVDLSPQFLQNYFNLMNFVEWDIRRRG